MWVWRRSSVLKRPHPRHGAGGQATRRLTERLGCAHQFSRGQRPPAGRVQPLVKPAPGHRSRGGVRGAQQLGHPVQPVGQVDGLVGTVQQSGLRIGDAPPRAAARTRRPGCRATPSSKSAACPPCWCDTRRPGCPFISSAPAAAMTSIGLGSSVRSGRLTPKRASAASVSTSCGASGSERPPPNPSRSAPANSTKSPRWAMVRSGSQRDRDDLAVG